ncbi:MAG: hypothetical protein IJ158_03130 [Treponema sp.]|nr:hypothetical protein [Treponema sp.]
MFLAVICALFTITALSCTQDGGNNTTDTEKASDDGKETTKNATYTVTIDSIEHGIVMASKTSEIEEGETITLTVTATDGYELSSLSIKILQALLYQPNRIQITAQNIYSPCQKAMLL